MAIIMRIKSYPGLYAGQKMKIEQPQKYVTIKMNSSLCDRLQYLNQNIRQISACESLPELREQILHYALTNFSPFGKSVVFAGYMEPRKYTSLTIPQDAEPLPNKIARYAARGTDIEPSFPIQANLIKDAINTNQILIGESEKEDFMAVPLIDEDQNTLLGVLLFSNRLSSGFKKFNEDDVEVARALAEIASEAISKLLPKPTYFSMGPNKYYIN